MPGPVLWGPNNISNNLQGGELLNSGALINANGPKNYCTGGNFQNGTVNGFTLGTVGTLTNGIPTGTPTFGSGAAGTLVLSAASTSPISGVYSLAYASATAVTTVGNMVASPAYTIDPEDQAKVLTWKFYYSAISGTTNINYSGTSSNSFGVAIYDVTNASWLSSTANFGMTQGTGVGIATGTCQTNVNTSQLRFVMYNVNATSGPVVLYLADIFVGPQTAPIGAVVTDWQSYTPTYTGFGTVTAAEAWWRRVGDSIYLRGRFLAGTATAVVGSVSFPNSYTYDPSKETLASSMYGQGTNGGTSTVYSVIAGSGVGTNIIQFGSYGNNASLAGALATNIASGGTFSYETSTGIPITGWSSNVQMSSDTDTRVIALYASGCTNTLTASFSTLIFPTVGADTAGAYNSSTGVYTAQISGYYNVNCFFSIGTSVAYTTGSGIYMQYVKNGAAGIAMGANVVSANATVSPGLTGSIIVKMNAGDTLALQGASTTTASVTGTGSNISINRISGPSVIAATESVNARYFGSTTTISGTTTIVMGTKSFDSHNAYSAGTYTIPVSGKYQFNANLACTGTYALNNVLELMIFQNGTAVSAAETVSGGALSSISAFIGDIITCNAGDLITLRAINTGTSPVISASSTLVYMSIARVGN